MINNNIPNTAIGEVVSYNRRLNPFSKIADVLVKVNDQKIQIPVDHRQVRFIEKEYPEGSKVTLEFDGRWTICSQMAPAEFDFDSLSRDVYY